MDDVLAAEIEGIVDKQLQDCGFIDLCTRIAQKVVEKVQRIEEDHGKIKGDINGIEEKLNVLLTEKIPPENKPLPVKKDVIVIEEEEDSKPLVAKLHEITKSSQMLSCNTEFMSPSNQQVNNTETISRTGKPGLSREQSTVSSSKQKMQLSSQYSDTKRNTSESTVVLEEEEPDLIPTSSVQLNQRSDDQKILPDAGKKADGKSSQDSPKSPIVVSNVIDIPRSPLAPVDTSSSKNGSNEQLGMGISPSEVKSNCDGKPKMEKLKEADCSLKPDVVNDDKKQVPAPGSVVLPEQHKESVEDKEKEMESQEELALESYEYKEGDRVLGKPDKSDIWYTAKISKIIVNKYNQRKYQVKFESGLKIHGTLPGNSLAPIAHPKQSSLNIGSRVAAIRPRETVDARIQKKYMNLYASDFAKGEILFGGVVVERACEENRYRFLVVFDDGFADYMTEKKMHLVINAAEDVWQDVSVHCREFIKEYLEEYPKRPMLKVKPGLSIQTEWNGKWLQAKVIAVDCSLVKMLFDVDKRTEWIYRGSTRLEPLYSELERRDLEALKSKGRKWNKKKRSFVVKKVEPYVEDAITKPCFGISRFSKTDPKGLQQIKEWGPAIEKNSPTTSQDELMLSDSDINNTESPAKIALDATASATATPESSSRKRKLDEPVLASEASADTNNVETESGNDGTPATKDIASVLPMASHVTPGNSPSSKATPIRRSLQRNSSQSSIESTASDSQLLLRNNKYGRLKRQLSSSSVRSAQSDRTDMQPRGNSQVKRDIYRIDLTDTPRSPGSTHKLPISESSPVKEKTSIERTSLVRPFQRLILPRPTVQQPVQFWIPQGSGPFPFPQVFIPKLAINQLNLAHVQFRPQITGNVITVGSLAQSFPKVKGPHDCSSSCILHVRLAPGEKQKHNPLSIPLILGWTRETAKRRPGYHRDIYYRAPCSRRLRNMAEVSKFLLRTSATNVTIDQFSFDSSVSCRDQIPVFRLPKLHIEDISYGKEKVPIPCVNEKSDELPPHVEYISNRIVGKGININTDRSFLACCDCTDNCQDKTKCACARLTIDSSDAIDGKRDEHNGYHYRRLKECVTTGIYECNQNCSCSETCHNRVVQNGIGVRLQVFMTDSKGWGLRCLDDIPRGTFICTYSGQILNEEMADKEGTDYGDEYLAELDHIEVVEKAKEGYESDVPELRREKKTRRSRSFESSTRGFDSSDSDDSDFDFSSSPASSENLSNVSPVKDIEPAAQKTESKETRSHVVDDVIDLTLDSDPEIDNGLEIAKKGNQRTSSLECRHFSSSSLKYMMQKLQHGRNGEKEPKCVQLSPNNDGKYIDGGLVSKDNVDKTPSPKFLIEMDSSDSLLQEEDCEVEEMKNEKRINIRELDPTSVVAKKGKLKPGEKNEVIDKCSQVKLDQAKELKGADGEELNNLSKNLNCEVKNAVGKVGRDIRKAVAKKTTRSILFQRLSNAKRTHCEDDDNCCYRSLGDLTPPFSNGSQVRLTPRVADTVLMSEMNPGKTFTSPRSSTGGHFARKALKLQITPPGQQQMSSDYQEQQQQQVQKDILAERSTRDYFGEDQCYVIDAKSFGNIGRYLNHSCSPNLFVQNVFIDTHDLRFPFVAFFAQQNIAALSELTWDYSYEVGSVPGKVLQCYCGAVDCRGRLL